MSTCINAKVNLKIYENGTFDRTFTWTTTSEGITSPVDLTGSQIFGVLRLSTDATDILLSLPFHTDAWLPDSPTGFYITDPIEGKFKLYIKDEESLVCVDHKDIKCIFDAYVNTPADEIVLKLSGPTTIVASAYWGLP